MPVWIESLELDDGNILHLAERHIDEDEVYDVLREIRLRNHAVRHGGRLYVYGLTSAGRYLVLVLLPLGRGVYRPVTGWQMDEQQRSAYWRAIGREP